MKSAQDSLRDFWNHVKHTNIRIIGVPEEEDKKKDREKILEDSRVYPLKRKVL